MGFKRRYRPAGIVIARPRPAEDRDMMVSDFRNVQVFAQMPVRLPDLRSIRKGDVPDYVANLASNTLQAIAIHGGKDNQCVNEERRPELDFECIGCHRECCWCFGSTCEADNECPEGMGLCCDCSIERLV